MSFTMFFTGQWRWSIFNTLDHIDWPSWADLLFTCLWLLNVCFLPNFLYVCLWVNERFQHFASCSIFDILSSICHSHFAPPNTRPVNAGQGGKVNAIKIICRKKWINSLRCNIQTGGNLLHLLNFGPATYAFYCKWLPLKLETWDSKWRVILKLNPLSSGPGWFTWTFFATVTSPATKMRMKKG